MKKVILFLLSILIIYIFFLPRLLGIQDIKASLDQELQIIAVLEGKTKIEIKGQIKLKMLPRTRFVISNINFVNDKNLFISKGHIAQVELYSSPVKLFLGRKIEITKAVFDRIVYEIEIKSKQDIDINTLDITQKKGLTEFKDKMLPSIVQKIYEHISAVETTLENNPFVLLPAELNFTNSQFIVYKKDSSNHVAQKVRVSDINVTIKSQNLKISEITGSLKVNKEKIEIKYNLKNNQSADAIVKSNLFKLISNYKIPKSTDEIIEGANQLRINNLQSFTKWLFPENSWQYKRIVSEEQVDMRFNVIKEKKLFKIDQINIQSSNANIKGEITNTLALDEDSKLNIKLAVENLNLDKLITRGFISTRQQDINSLDTDKIFDNKIFSMQGVDSKTEGNNLEKPFEVQALNTENKQKNISIFENFDTTIDIQAEEILYNKHPIKKFVFKARPNNKTHKLFVTKLECNLPGETIIGINNDTKETESQINIKVNKLPTLLEWLNLNSSGLFKVESIKKADLKGILKLDENKIFLKNLTININDDFSFNSKGVFGYDDKGIKYLVLQVLIDKLNLDEYLDFEVMNSLIDKSKSVSTLKESLLWLNILTLNTIIDLNIKEIQYKNQNIIKDYETNIQYGEGFLNLQDINLHTSNLFFKDSDISFNIKQAEPRININLDIEKTKNQTIEEEKSGDLENYTEKATVITTIKNNKKILSRLFDLPSLYEFNGNIKLKVTNQNKQNKAKFQDLLIESSLINGRINFDKIESSVFKGKLLAQGFLDLKQERKINLVLNNSYVSAKEVLLYLYNIDNIIGYTALNGIMEARGMTYDTFINSLKIQGKTKGSKTVINNFGLNMLTKQMLQMHKSKQILEKLNIEETLYNDKSTTVFNETEGVFALDKNHNMKFKFNLTGTNINGLCSGIVNKNNLNSNTNFVFATGINKTKTPINLAVHVTKNKNSQANVTTNSTQAIEYIRRIKQIMFPNNNQIIDDNVTE